MAPARPRVLLLVDDNPDLHVLLRVVAEEDHPSVRIVLASSGAEGLRKAAQHKPDIVVADYVMPVMDGIQFLAQCAAVVPGAKRYLLTGLSESKAAREAASSGRLDSVLAKPADLEGLQAMLARLLG